MTHLQEGEIRAYQDQELIAETHQRVEAHLKTCALCQAKAAALLSISKNASQGFASLAPHTSQPPLSPQLARARLAARLDIYEKEHTDMFSKFIDRIPRPVWAALAVTAILAIALSFAPVRAIASNILGLFRVEQIRVVQVRPGDMPDHMISSTQLEQLLSETAEIEEKGEMQEVASANEASKLAGIPVRLPTAMEEHPELVVQPNGNIKFNIDLELVQTILDDIDRSDIVLPPDLDGARVEIKVPSSVIAQYGECIASDAHFDPDSAPQKLPELNCTVLIQMPSPTISGPPGLNVSQVGEAYLQVLGMSPEEASSFADNVDWTTTFVIPVPLYGTGYKDVRVDGVTGTLIQYQQYQGNETYVIFWVKDGIVYALSGPGEGATGLRIANSFK